MSIRLPPHLSGEHGRLRPRDASGAVIPPLLLSATTDLEAIDEFLKEDLENRRTYESYRKECYRLLKWAIEIKGKPLSSLVREDYHEFIEFLRSPPESWCSSKRRPIRLANGAWNPEWKPFVGPLQERSVDYARTVINAMLNWLVDAGYLVAQPMALVRKRLRGMARRDRAKHTAEMKARRILTSEDMAAIEAVLPDADPRQRWIFWLFRLTGIRRIEAVANTMASFIYEDRRWRFSIIGKGNDHRTLPVDPRLLPELEAYRLSQGLTPWPEHDDPAPLIASSVNGEGLGERRIHGLFKDLLNTAADYVLETDPSAAQSAGRLRAASLHWMRHTYATRLLNDGANPRHVQALLGHVKFETTAGYWDELFLDVAHTLEAHSSVL